jgi:hypothetical protein
MAGAVIAVLRFALLRPVADVAEVSRYFPHVQFVG